VTIPNKSNITLTFFKNIIPKKFDFFSSIIRNIFEIFLLLLLLFSFILFVDVQKELSSNLPKLIIFFLVIFRTYPSFGRISSLRLSLKNNQYAVNEIYNIIKENKNKNINFSKKFKFQKKIEIKNLFFKYENKNNFALKNINFIIKKNQIIGITGKNGSGKTTLCNILLTLLSPVSGKITVDNKFDIFKNVGSYRKLISFIPQNIYLLNDTIERNITLCLETEKVDYKKLRYYSNVLNITHLIKKNNNLLKNINIGENGNYLSGGEKQRIAIARALYQDAEIIIMDEHTSSLDLKSEREIMKDLVKLKSTKTFFIISHRTEVFKFCDKVVTLEDGKVINIKLNNL
jgi:ABC-type bacteriocin/lantibiotic exporter with double-glycine peptidase domain